MAEITRMKRTLKVYIYMTSYISSVCIGEQGLLASHVHANPSFHFSLIVQSERGVKNGNFLRLLL